MNKLYLLVVLSFLQTAIKSQHVQKVTSINYYGNNGLNPRDITVFNNKLYFFGTDEKVYVDKLMASDGTEAGTTVIKTIDSAKGYTELQNLTILNNLLIFNNLNQLWKSDGTTAGTGLLASVKMGSANFAILNNKLYFAADNTNSSPIKDQLWQTDGTVAGTVLFKTINPSGAAGIANLFVAGGKIYFNASNGINTDQLWVSDGTPAGTVQQKIINPTGRAFPNNFISYNLKVYFSANNGVNGEQIWESDGTTLGTVKITQINSPGYGLSPRSFINFNGKLFFNGFDTGSHYQLFATDGTAAGTVKIKTDYSVVNGTLGFNPTSMVVHKNKLYFAGYDSITRFDQLWVSDGTTAGTVRVTASTKALYPSKLYSFQNMIVMTAYDTINKSTQLWVSDGTASGTSCPKPPDTWSSYPFYPFERFVPFNNALYFRAAYSYFSDYQLCRYSELPSGIAVTKQNKVSVYPNPAKTNFKINSDKEIISFRIIAMDGRIARAVNHPSSNLVLVDELSPGIYQLEVEDLDGIKYFSRFVKSEN